MLWQLLLTTSLNTGLLVWTVLQVLLLLLFLLLFLFLFFLFLHVFAVAVVAAVLVLVRVRVPFLVANSLQTLAITNDPTNQTKCFFCCQRFQMSTRARGHRQVAYNATISACQSAWQHAIWLLGEVEKPDDASFGAAINACDKCHMAE